MKTAIISGASRGIGKAIALKLGREGCTFRLISRSTSELESLKSELETLGSIAQTFKCDISNVEEVEQCTAEILNSVENIDLLVLNAGVGSFAAVADSNVSDWDSMMSTNAKGSYLLSKQIAPRMIAAGDGQMIFIASDVSRRTFPNGAIYCASKFAQFAFASALRQELRPAGVRVSIIMPGLVASNFNGGADPSVSQDWLRPDDVADAVAYIANSPKHVLIDEITLHPVCQEI